MEKKLLKTYCVLTILFALFINAQNITVVDTNSKPLANVLVFDKDGNLLSKTDIEGNFDKKSIEPLQSSYIFKQENANEDAINSKEFTNDTIVLNNRVVQIPEVIISTISNPNYVVIRGYFNNYITLNNKLNCYVDGIVEYTFDYKTKEYINSNIIEYRTFVLKEKSNEGKEVSTFSFDTMVRIPELEKITQLDKLKDKKDVVFKTYIDVENDKTNVQYTSLRLQDKVVKLFGYLFTEGSSVSMFSFSKTKNYDLIRNLDYFNHTYQINLKHKTEENYNAFKGYSNFYPEKVYYLKDKKKNDKIKLNRNKSSYSDNYWKNSVLESTYNTFSNFFKTDLVEQPNSFKSK
ncbi:hypothetical protein Q73A0000_12605 [Kaistella flava (ex Peng et al. 2021)]|uniref:Uncharacterized protein n=1 Tax=Kaistella flava (ex Peng et al. 2021) TaxID=2038776 RepID=A0A7M2YBC3_9FLAO|nr:hypothetical protein [Kaistella flava (ex Peng et al. 2021)]QOW11139.1 hypothetical protein Q73A0000_12605 [Kaistella flava (ex Peng et al. 2021)]